ncbi:MAG: phage minor head protein [Phocaeicola sp.]
MELAQPSNEPSEEPYNQFQLLVKLLHRKGEMKPELLAEPEAKLFAEVHAQSLNDAFRTVPMTDTMRDRLEHSNLVFSGFKTFHELNEAFPLLTKEDGTRKPFKQFLNDVQTINEQYNKHYLRAEYNFAIASGHMAAKWEGFVEDEEDEGRYHLQYRTVGDGKVREEHEILNNITLPKSSPFWDENFPPNGWNCRCNVVQVRAGKYPVSDEKEAIERGKEATRGKHTEMMRFNPGKQRAAFPAYNPYTTSKCTGCSKNSLNLMKLPSNELCEACPIIQQCAGDASKSKAAIERTHYMREMEPLLKEKVLKDTENAKIKIGFNKYGNEHLYSDTMSRTKGILKKEHLSNLDNILRDSTFHHSSKINKERKDHIDWFYYFNAKLDGKDVLLNVARRPKREKRGKVRNEYFLYSVTKGK